MPKWLVKLTGDEADLETATQLLSSQELNVRKVRDHYYLQYLNFDVLESADEVRARASVILRRSSAAERIRCGSSLPLEIADGESVFRIEPDGSRHPFFCTILENSWNVRRQHAPVTEREAAAMGAWIDLAEHDDRVDKALRLLIDPQFSYWVILWNILELIESDVGGKITKDAWASRKEIERFTRTVNSATVLGDAARHGFEQHEPPPDPMSLEEAQALIHRILRSWLNSKIDRDDGVS